MTDKKEEKDRKRREPLRITVRLSPPLAEKLQDLVESGMYKNLSEVVRKALSDLIKKHYPPPHRSTVTVDLPLSLKKELEKLVLGKTVRLEGDIEERDRYGRLLRHIYVDDIFVNAELIKLGLARAKFYPPNVKYRELFYKLEKEAKEKRRGIWR